MRFLSLILSVALILGIVADADAAKKKKKKKVVVQNATTVVVVK